MRDIFTAKGTIYACTKPECMISISKYDPACGKWRECEERMPPCPKHGVPMRAFFRASDGFKKLQCPECRKEGKMTQVMTGKVSDMGPQDAQTWSVDPKDLN
jgi:hypothetical protein